MELMHRFGSDATPEYADGYLNAVLKHPGSCDNVWFATKYGYPKIETHKEYAVFLAKMAEKFKDTDITVSLQLSNTIGHGEYMSGNDCSGLLYEGSPVRKLVGHDGTVAGYCFCWRDEYFKQYTAEELKAYLTVLKPDVVWVDDDFRAQNHSPVEFGCFCDECIKEFNEKYGANFTREELTAEILHGDIIWRKRFIEFTREGLYNLMYEISKAVHEYSPETKMGLQYGVYGAYTGYGCGFIFDAMKAATGSEPLARPGGGAYNDHNPNLFLEKAVKLNVMNSQLPEYVKRKCPEIENLPFCVFGKSPAGTAFETSYYFANGNTDMTYSLAMRFTEAPEYHEQALRLFSEQREYWDKMALVNESTYQSGMQIFISKETWKKKLSKEDSFKSLSDEGILELLLWERDGFPISFDKNDETAFVLCPKCAQNASKADIEYLLTKRVITDAKTLEILKEKGFDLGVKALPVPAGCKIRECMTAAKVNGGLKRFTPSTMVAGYSPRYYMENINADIEVFGYYDKYLPETELCGDKNYPYGIADLFLNTKEGGKWAVFAASLWVGIMPYGRREQILNAVDYITDDGLPARILDKTQAVLLPRKEDSGKTACVSVTNATIGDFENIRILIRNPKSENFSFMSQYDGRGKLDFEKDGNDYIVTVPKLKAWSVATVFMD